MRPAQPGMPAPPGGSAAPAPSPPYRLNTEQRERLAGYRALDERETRKTVGVATDVIAAAIAGETLAPALIARLTQFLAQQQPAA